MWFTSSVGVGLRATVVVLAVVVVDSGCGINREGFNGLGLPAAADQTAAERNLRGVLVDAFHAEPDDADCLVAEAFRNRSINPDRTSPVSIEWSKAEFEEFADRCNMDLDDLWRSRD